MVDAQELRRRWTDKTNAVFGPSDMHDYHEYAAENYEREFDFKGCRSIVFLHGHRTGRETDVLLLTQGSGHMTLPAGVQVLVQSGYARWEPAASAGGGSTIVGMGRRAPPPSRVSGYAHSSADSGYSGSGRSNATGYRLSPPRDAASFSRGAGSSYMSACDIPLPRSDVGRRSSADSDWEVVEEAGGYSGRNRDDACSIAPSESISSVGSRGSASQYSRRYTRDY
ncbi:hypothetical protein VTI74DRAFT_7605 [Chaetomium olivicolor]